MRQEHIIKAISIALIVSIAVLAFAGINSLGNGVLITDHEVRNITVNDSEISFDLELDLYSDMSFDVQNLQIDASLTDYVYGSEMPMIHLTEDCIRSKSHTDLCISCSISVPTAYIILNDMISAKGSVVTIHMDISGNYMMNLVSYDAGVDIRIRLAEENKTLSVESQWYGDTILDTTIHNLNRGIQIPSSNALITDGNETVSVIAVQTGTDLSISFESEGPLKQTTEKLIESDVKKIFINGEETYMSPEGLNMILNAIGYILEACS